MDPYSRERLADICRSVDPAGRMVSIGAGYRRYKRNVALCEKREAWNAAVENRARGPQTEAIQRIERTIRHLDRSLAVNPPPGPRW